ncbi:hypothetical protein SDC9_189318 [bioreactor metagenome]|uniref:DUF4250 domain-containing protein n=1 Tax=bioreactor metagenome TaxID=1076179 RepID=A0A645I2N5_9ZZZZ|nr:DUF4250 domain-containing protein [Proteiniclasticum sp. QWL-01]WFF73170.1 DUF4250 domain-containing protein [Proteiniclasticum sp. QWL-01]
MDLKNFQTMDPNILYSIVNARLRVTNSSLTDFCEDQALDLDQFSRYMEQQGFVYHPETNQFR